jgi:hypothetical protein
MARAVAEVPPGFRGLFLFVHLGHFNLIWKSTKYWPLCPAAFHQYNDLINSFIRPQYLPG